MSDCTRFRDRLAASLDGQLEDHDAFELRQHRSACSECDELAEALVLVGEAGSLMADLKPPQTLEKDLQGSPCQRWQTLLFQAIDSDICEENLDRLLLHLEDCETCAELWTDLTLVHQVAQCMEPPQHLLQRCVWGIKKNLPLPVIGRRAAVAVAYFLTVIATLVGGSSVTLARNPAAETLRNVAGSVAEEVATVTDDSRGEFRVMLWRAWTWTSTTVASAQELLNGLNTNTDIESDQGDQT